MLIKVKGHALFFPNDNDMATWIKYKNVSQELKTITQRASTKSTRVYIGHFMLYKPESSAAWFCPVVPECVDHTPGRPD